MDLFFYYGIMIETFSNLLRDYFKQKKSIPEFVRENYPLHEYQTKDRTIRRYLSGEVVPQYSAAKDLVDKLDISISEEDLIKILNYSKSERETVIDYKHSYIFEKISARSNDLFKDSDMTEYEKQRLFKDRVDEVTTDGNIREYLVKLIEYDLENNIEFDKWGTVPQLADNSKTEGE